MSNVIDKQVKYEIKQSVMYPSNVIRTGTMTFTGNDTAGNVTGSANVSIYDISQDVSIMFVPTTTLTVTTADSAIGTLSIPFSNVYQTVSGNMINLFQGTTPTYGLYLLTGSVGRFSYYYDVTDGGGDFPANNNTIVVAHTIILPRV